MLKLVWADSFVEEQNITRIIHTLRKTLGEDENGNKFIETVAKKGYRFVANVTEVRETPEPKSTQTGAQASPLAMSAKRENSRLFFSNSEGNEAFSRPKRTLIASEDACAPVNRASEDACAPVLRRTHVKQKTRIVLFSVGFLSVVFLLLFLSFNFQSDSATGPNEVKSIAVLPLNSLTAENRDAIYELGIADSLIHRLSSIKGFVVRPLSATRKYADVGQDPLAAGREQQADYVLASNYQLAGGRIRVTAQLFNVASGQIEETKIIEKDAGNIFAMQDAVAGEVGNILLARFATTSSSPAAKRRTTNEEAYRLYLQGRNLTARQSPTNLEKAVEYFEQAVKLDPNFALGYSGMAHAYILSSFRDGELPRVENEKAKEAVTKALELDKNLAEGYAVRGQLKLIYEWDLAGAEKDLLRAIELEPNSDLAHWVYALLLAYRGRIDEALGEIETTLAIDPGSILYQRTRGRFLYYARRYDEAIVQFKRVIELNENSGSAWNYLYLAYEMKGDYAGAYESFIKRQKQTNPDRIEVYQRAYETAGWQGVRRKLLEFDKLDEEKPGTNLFAIARQCALLGEKEQAFEYLNKAFEKHQSQMVMLNAEPTFDSLRDDPRFDELVRRVGLK